MAVLPPPSPTVEQRRGDPPSLLFHLEGEGTGRGVGGFCGGTAVLQLASGGGLAVRINLAIEYLIARRCPFVRLFVLTCLES